MSFKLDDSYVDVAERVREFYEKNPNGAIRRVESRFVTDAEGHLLGYFYRAAVYRNLEDTVPAGEGEAFEQIPGKTPYTKDSEVMNAETSAWGRAIVAAGIPSKKIASANEVLARQDGAPQGSPPVANPAAPPSANGTTLTFGAHKGKTLEGMIAAGGKEAGYVSWIAGEKFEPKSADQTAIKLAAMALTGSSVEAQVGAAFPNDSDIPFAASWA